MSSKFVAACGVHCAQPMSASGRVHTYGIAPQSCRTRGALIGYVRPMFEVLDFTLLRDLPRITDFDPKVFVQRSITSLGSREGHLLRQETHRRRSLCRQY